MSVVLRVCDYSDASRTLVKPTMCYSRKLMHKKDVPLIRFGRARAMAISMVVLQVHLWRPMDNTTAIIKSFIHISLEGEKKAHDCSL